MGGARNRTLSSALGDPATLLLISASLVAAALILYFERRITFRLDEWEFLVARPGLTWDSVFLPHNEHIVVGPVLVYKALIAVFGTDSPRPFQVVAVACFIASVALLYVWLRRRVGEWLALAGVPADPLLRRRRRGSSLAVSDRILRRHGLRHRDVARARARRSAR